MDRIKEIEIIIEALVQEVKLVINSYPTLIEDTIVKNGSLIEKYNKEMEALKIK